MMPVPAKDPIASVRLWLLVPIVLGVIVVLALVRSRPPSELEKQMGGAVVYATLIVWWLSTVARATRRAGFRPSLSPVGAWLKLAAKVALAGMLAKILWMLLKHWLALPKVGLVNAPVVVAKEPTVLTFAITVLLMAVLTPLAEEMLFRASLFRKWRYRIGPTAAVLLTSVLFALLHANAPTSGLVALAMAVLYTTTGTIWAPIAAHAMNNLFAVTLVHAGRIFPPFVFELLADSRVHIAALLPALLGSAWLVRFLYRGWHTLGAPVDGVRAEDPPASTVDVQQGEPVGVLDSDQHAQQAPAGETRGRVLV